jgi:hypothetical protein
LSSWVAVEDCDAQLRQRGCHFGNASALQANIDERIRVQAERPAGVDGPHSQAQAVAGLNWP